MIAHVPLHLNTEKISRKRNLVMFSVKGKHEGAPSCLWHSPDQRPDIPAMCSVALLLKVLASQPCCGMGRVPVPCFCCHKTCSFHRPVALLSWFSWAICVSGLGQFKCFSGVKFSPQGLFWQKSFQIGKPLLLGLQIWVGWLQRAGNGLEAVTSSPDAGAGQSSDRNPRNHASYRKLVWTRPETACGICPKCHLPKMCQSYLCILH